MLSKEKKYPLILAIAYGVAYGVVAQFAIRLNMLGGLFGAMSFGFVFVLPFVFGVITLWFADKKSQQSWIFRIFAPWGSTSICLVFSLLVGWEGTICMIMAAIIYLPFASIGGVVTGVALSWHNARNKVSSTSLVAVMLLPILFVFSESLFPLPVEYRKAETSIDIEAPVSKVWENIIRVKPINEPLNGFFYKMGFPKPIAATLSHEGIGGVRKASFERGLVFTETVDRWEPEKAISFDIEVEPGSVPLTTLDEHVMVGGRYFDVLRGTYEIERLDDSHVRLHLSSEFRVSTRFNFYAGIWARFLMLDIQQTILEVIKSRCER